ncbi:MAG: BspA family leucine-rich repeat surface protein [Balneolaceae bacterium]|nr:BspA family leucine-rich repeat surface protein [Balneolaceae bacterium]
MRTQLLLIILLFFVTNSLIAQNRYVAPGGSDTTDCSDDTAPCETIFYTLGQSDPDDTINLAPGEYTESFSIFDNITIQGTDAATTIIQAHENRGVADSRVITISDATTEVNLNNVTVRHGNFTLAGSVGGGGIYNNGILTLTNSLVINNDSASRGGGISTEDNSATTLNNSIISGNISGAEGGGIWSGGGLTIENNSSIADNEADATAGGGGIYSITAETVTISSSTISGNSSGGVGGGIWQASGSGQYQITESRIENNEAGSSGGGMFSQGNLEIVSSTFSQNEAGGSGGGGIFISGVVASITNSVFSGNDSGNSGGGIALGSGTNLTLAGSLLSGNIANNGGGLHNNGSTSTLTNVTIAGNRASFGGGGLSNLNNSNPILTNVILWGNRAEGGGDQIDNSGAGTNIPEISYSLIEDSGGSGAWDTDLGSNDGNNLDADPGFTDPRTAGPDDPTSDGDFTVLASSPVINAGLTPADLSIFPGGPGDPIDLAGNPRVDGAAIDMGAYEFEGDPEIPGAFITTWKTDNPGTSTDLQITIPTTGGGYNYDVHWVDVNNAMVNGTEANVAGNLIIDFPAPGTYQVEITGDFPRIYFNNSGDKDKILTVEQWGDIEWTSMEVAFYGASNLQVSATDAPDLRGVSSLRLMFSGASSLNADLNHWDVSSITDMSYMFAVAVAFNQPIADWEVSSVENMEFMFHRADAFNQPIGNWNVSSVEDMNRMLSGAVAFNQDIGNWDVSSVNDMSGMFFDASAFNQDIGNWNVSLVENMGGMFNSAALFNQDISTKIINEGTAEEYVAWNVSSVENMTGMFENAASFNQPIIDWDISSVTVMRSMFNNATSFNQDIGVWNVADITDMDGMLNNSGLSTANYDATLTGWAALPPMPARDFGAEGLEYCAEAARNTLTDDYGWTITDAGLSTGCSTSEPFVTTWQTNNPGHSNDNQIRIPGFGNGYDFTVDWGDGNSDDFVWSSGEIAHHVEHTYAAEGIYTVTITGDFPRIFFDDAGDKEKILSVEQWGDVEWSSMERAFWGASNLQVNAADAPDLSGVTSMSLMFRGASSLNDDLNHWDVTNVTDMSYLFAEASLFNGNIVGWNVSNVENMSGMFINAADFDQDISGWVVTSATTMTGMFSGAGSFNQDISGWNVSSTEVMNEMFFGASSFNQNIGIWNISNVTNMEFMLGATGLTTENYDNILIGWAAQAVQPNVTLGAGGLEYCNAGDERQSLIDAPNEWNILDSGRALGCPEEQPFITTWKTDNPGTSTDFQITIPVIDGGYDFTVHWGDGNSTDWEDGDPVENLTHTYAAAGTYTVEITGDFPRIYFNNEGDREKILSVDQWGDIEWSMMGNAFWGATNLEVHAIDAPDLSNVTSTMSMFQGASSFNQDISGWDVSNVENMTSMFHGASTFNQDISGWNVSGVNNMNGMLRDASVFDQDLGGWDITGVTNMSSMLDNTGLSTANYDATLIGWEPQAVQTGITLGAAGLTYCSGQTAWESLTDPATNDWTIIDAGLAAGCTSPGAFVTTWQTDNPGDSNDDQIRIPLFGDGYDFTVDWGDGNSDDFVLNPGAVAHHVEHTYAAEGTYTVTITGDFPRIFFSNDGDKDKILTIEQWGDIEWTSMEQAFRGASNLEVNATDAPDLSNVTNMLLMFAGAASLNSDFNHWDTSNIEVMSQLFSGATAFNGAIDQWDVSSVTTMFQMFRNATSFNQDLNDWVVTSLNSIDAMFWGATSFNGNITGWTLPGGITNMSNMFSEASAFNQDISGWNLSGAVFMNGTFFGATSFDQDLGGWDISSVEEMIGMLENTALSTANYDATLIGWAGQAVQAGVELGAEGLEYCSAEAERQTLIDAPNNWTITDAGLAAGCEPLVIEDPRILASNRSDLVFSDTDLDPTHSVRIVSLPDKGQLLFEGAPVTADQIITVPDLDAGKMVWSHTTDEHGYNYTNFAARIIDDVGVESELFEIKIDLGAAFVDLVHDGEGWRFMTSPAAGETFASLLGPVYTQGIPGSNNPAATFPNVYRIDQANYDWEVPGHMDEEIGIGEAFIVYVFSDDDGGGTPDGFPKTLLSGESWMELADGFDFSGLNYDPDPAGVNPDNFYLIANPHPLSLDFCQMLIFLASEISPFAHFWDPSANGGNGDYVAETCLIPPAIHIAPFQAFWVQTFAANPELSTGFFLETMEGGFFKDQPGLANMNTDQANPYGDVMHVSLEVAGKDGVFTNQANLLFSDEGTLGRDRFDVPKLDASGLAQRWISFHTLDESGRAYAYRSLPLDFGDQISLPLDIRTTEQAWFEMGWNLPDNQQMIGDFWLRDNQTGNVLELRHGQTYRFEMDNRGMKWQDENVFPLQTTAGLIHQTAESSEQPRFELLITRGNVDGLSLLGDLPDRVNLAQNYPNPFNPTTVISFELPQQSQVYLEVFDMIGRRVATLVESSTMQAGRHQVNFDASGLTSGVYIYRLQAGSTVQSRKLTLVK